MSTTTTTTETASAPILSSNPKTFTHHPSAASTFPATLPLIANNNAFLADIQTSSDATAPISAGFFRLEKGTPLVYEYTYEEMKIIVEGEFLISDESGQKVKGVKGDVFYFPKGSKITFETEGTAVGFFVGQRANGAA